MASLNKCTFIGNLGQDPELRHMPSGDAVCNISIGCNEKWKDKSTGEAREHTEWIRVSFFGKLADIAGQYLKKGSQVYVEGSLRTRKYVDKDGVEKYATDIRADEMKMLGSAPSGGGQESRQTPTRGSNGGAGPAAQRPAPNFSDMDDDIPF